MLSLSAVSKSFSGRPAVSGLSLEIPEGALFGLLGHNGAGKSTTIGMTLGQVFPDSGTITIGGHDVFESRIAALSLTGAIFESPCFYDYLSGWMNLRAFSSFSGKVPQEEMARVVETVGLTRRIHDPVRTYSHGMRQKLALAQSLLPQPRVLILDEPTDGLDPEGIHEMRETIVQLHRNQGLTILLSSHLLSEIQNMCTHVGIMKEGKLIHAGPTAAICQAEGWINLETDRTADALELLRSAGLAEETDSHGNARLRAGLEAADAAELLVGRGHRLRRLAPRQQSLEEFYMETSRSAKP